MSIHTNHKALIATASTIFLSLSMLVAVLPAFEASKIQALPGAFEIEISAEVKRGREIYLKEGCATCHTQFVRNLPMDAPYGRGSIAADYALESPPLLGTQRTGPDLANVGIRQPSEVWNLIHLYNPRAVVSSSVMPSYPWLFEVKAIPEESDITVPLSGEFAPDGVVVAKQSAIDLVRYLQSLKQPEIK